MKSISKKKYLCFLGLFCVLLSGCGNNDGSSSSSTSLLSFSSSASLPTSSAVSSQTTSASSESNYNTDYYLGRISSASSFYAVKCTAKIMDGTILVMNSTTRYEVDITDSIEHYYSYKMYYTSTNDNVPSRTETDNIYKTKMITYTLGDDQKYSVATNQSNVIAIYSLHYDFSYSSDLIVSEQTIYSVTIGGTIVDPSKFAGSGSFDGAANFSFAAHLEALDKEKANVEKLNISYVQSGLSITADYEYSFIEPNLTIPTV